jgi:hypothetical protein
VSFAHTLFDRTVGFEGSTRPLALMRICLALIAWSRYALDLSLFQRLTLGYTVLGLAFFVSSTAMLFGIASRVATAATGVLLLLGTYVYLGLFRGVEPFTHHHCYLLSFAICLLALTPCGKSYSFDRWRAVVRAEREGKPAPPERGLLWAQRLIALQIAALYFWSAYDKTNVAFLSGARLEMIAGALYFGSDFPRSPLFHTSMVFLAWATVVLEYLLAFGLFVPGLRGPLILAGFIFHAIIYVTLPVATFSVTMWVLYLSFLEPDEVHGFLDHWSGR